MKLKNELFTKYDEASNQTLLNNYMSWADKD